MGFEHDVRYQLAWYHLFMICIAIGTSWIVLIFNEECVDVHVDIVSHLGIGTGGVFWFKDPLYNDAVQSQVVQNVYIFARAQLAYFLITRAIVWDRPLGVSCLGTNFFFRNPAFQVPFHIDF